MALENLKSFGARGLGMKITIGVRYARAIQRKSLMYDYDRLIKKGGKEERKAEVM